MTNQPGDGGKPRKRSLLRRFFRDRRGATAVEFGIVVVPFLGLLLATLETAFAFLNGQGLEAAVQEAARNVMTGEAQAANITTSSQFVNSYLCPATGTRILPSFIDCKKLIVDVRTADTFSSADVTNDFYLNPSSQLFCAGGARSIVIVRVAYPMPVFLPIIAGMTNAAFHQITTGLVNNVPNNPGWKHLLLAVAVFQTEPFVNTTYTMPSNC